MVFLRLCWTIDAFALCFVLYLFVSNQRPAPTGPGYQAGWLMLTAFLCLGLFASAFLYLQQQHVLALLTAAVPTTLALLTGLWLIFYSLAGTDQRWR
ncbi:hypothetical protein [Tellurirhabdus rosea]|uniref:hypothetical protein n=1 Tax=Tellurirhabdus rosea TaxID=2674997 RepID=UPI0022574825|nr:hypothetical protein [Tellurirhabdus rosea]